MKKASGEVGEEEGRVCCPENILLFSERYASKAFVVRMATEYEEGAC